MGGRARQVQRAAISARARGRPALPSRRSIAAARSIDWMVPGTASQPRTPCSTMSNVLGRPRSQPSLPSHRTSGVRCGTARGRTRWVRTPGPPGKDTSMRSVALSPATREARWMHWRRRRNPAVSSTSWSSAGASSAPGAALDAATRGSDRRAGRGPRLRLRHVEPLEQAHPRRPALPGDARLPAGARGAAGARAAAPDARPAPGQAGAVRLPAAAPRLGAALRRRGRRALRHPRPAVGPGPGRAPPPPPHPPRRPADRPRAARRTRSSARCSTTTPRSTTRATRCRSPAPPRPTARTWPRGRGSSGCCSEGERVVGAQVHDLESGARVRGPRPPGRQRHRRVDRRHAGAGRRARRSSTCGRARASTSSCPATGSARRRA